MIKYLLIPLTLTYLTLPGAVQANIMIYKQTKRLLSAGLGPDSVRSGDRLIIGNVFYNMTLPGREMAIKKFGKSDSSPGSEFEPEMRSRDRETIEEYYEAIAERLI